MKINPAAINNEGVDRLLGFAQNPQTIGQDRGDGTQVYLPGIWIPGHSELSVPFRVPIIGDNEPTSLTIDWPVKEGATFYKRIALTAMLPAEGVIRGEPPEEHEADILDFIEFDGRFESLNEAYDGYTGEWGGFLYAAVSLDRSNRVTQSMAQFIVFESLDEFEVTHSLLITGIVSAAEIVGITRIQHQINASSTQSRTELATLKELSAANS